MTHCFPIQWPRQDSRETTFNFKRAAGRSASGGRWRQRRAARLAASLYRYRLGRTLGSCWLHGTQEKVRGERLLSIVLLLRDWKYSRAGTRRLRLKPTFSFVLGTYHIVRSPGTLETQTIFATAVVLLCAGLSFGRSKDWGCVLFAAWSSWCLRRRGWLCRDFSWRAIVADSGRILGPW